MRRSHRKAGAGSISEVGWTDFRCGRTSSGSLDELSPQTRRMLILLDGMVREACARLAMQRSEYRSTRKEVRDAADQPRVHRP